MAEHQCEYENCTSTETNEYVNQWERGDKDEHGNELDGKEWLCDEHAKRVGYCLWCGYFCAGSESYDFSPVEGYCRECLEDMKHETGDYDEDDYDGDDWAWWEYPDDWYDGSSLAELEPDTPTHRYIGPGSENAPDDDMRADSERDSAERSL